MVNSCCRTGNAGHPPSTQLPESAVVFEELLSIIQQLSDLSQLHLGIFSLFDDVYKVNLLSSFL